jgi:hypothetical protein
VTVRRAADGAGGDAPPRGFGDYRVAVNGADLPAGITVEARI